MTTGRAHRKPPPSRATTRWLGQRHSSDDEGPIVEAEHQAAELSSEEEQRHTTRTRCDDRSARAGVVTAIMMSRGRRSSGRR
jgi:hypothetical protein